MPTYTIRKLSGRAPEDWNAPAWKSAEVARIDKFHPRSSAHHPLVAARVLYDAQGLYVTFDVQDQYVRSVNIGYQASVCLDSCVEFFVRPFADKGYFNFELNCGGSLLLFFVEDPSRAPDGFAKYTKVDASLVSGVRIAHSLPERIDPEIKDPVHWNVQFTIPSALLEHFVGPLGAPAERRWTGNFYKCADETSHPHWGMWSPVAEELNFHLPQYFGQLKFAE